ncbi:MAG: hypothetical protein FJW20_16155 [Acidimicrobiia bacterium]|nr:hypothetical protein [Acidimicrobiia bacterium]
MSKEDKPLEYERRIQDTKSVAQRVDLDYLKRGNRFRDLRRKLTWAAPLVAMIGVAPFLAGIGGGEKIFSNGAVSRSHAMFESNCPVCHTGVFTSVADAACKNCHDGPPHPAKAIDTGKPNFELRCAQCHLEHQGSALLAEVADGNCTVCHDNLTANAGNVKLAANSVTAFREGKHPEFAALKLKDGRALKLNHAVHMPAQPKTIRNIKLPMKCGDCHTTDLNSPKGDLMPVSFEQHCRECHRRELEFDVYQALGAQSAPAPHTKDPEAIHNHIVTTYQNALAANPFLPQRALGRDFLPSASPAAWLEKVVRDSETFLFERKCKYCHEYEGSLGGYPVVQKVAPIQGRFAGAGQPGLPWLVRGEFSHRAHRAMECASCHTAAAASKTTSDVLIPKMADCEQCHGDSGTHLDRCAQCHQYHNKAKETDKDRRPVDQLIGYRREGS